MSSGQTASACLPDGRTIYLSDYERGGGARRARRGRRDERVLSLAARVRGRPGGRRRGRRMGGARRGRRDRAVPPRRGARRGRDVPANFVSSLCFGGADMRDVLITTADNHVQPELGGTLLRARTDSGAADPAGRGLTWRSRVEGAVQARGQDDRRRALTAMRRAAPARLRTCRPVHGCRAGSPRQGRARAGGRTGSPAPGRTPRAGAREPDCAARRPRRGSAGRAPCRVG